MILDDVTIQVSGGKGGDGAVGFNKNKMSLGPTGTSGGNGGSVYMEGVSNLSALDQFKRKKDIEAGDGRDGRSQFRDGERGKDVILQIPVGTVIRNLTTGEDSEIMKVGERILVAEGGKGGRGNFHFRSSRNTTPRQFEKGTEGESFELHLELKFIADVGLIGLPNVGKSSLINELTAAKSKVANYHFTTLGPHLGVYYELILADIPGLIEGASEGKGLGIKFLKHVERTRVLFHLISAESEDPASDYEVIRKELGAHNKELLKKKEYVFLSKSDEVSEEDLKKRVKALKSKKIDALPISILDPESIEEVKKILNRIQEEKTEG